MLKGILPLILLALVRPLFSQLDQTYTRQDGSEHLIGSVTIQKLTKDSTYQSWYATNYHDFELSNKKTSWTKNLRDMEVEIFFGSWCGDSRYWVPRFIKAWEELGLKPEQLKLIALYDGRQPGKYKQGPNGEEKGLDIHRVPTIIFRKEGQEIARIVEEPVNDLETDLAQIALGYPSQPNYRAATYLLNLFEAASIADINRNKAHHLSKVKWLTQNQNELNTLGYVLSASGRYEEALFVFDLNRSIYPMHYNVHDSYAEALAKKGEHALAIENYRKVLMLDPKNKNAKTKIQQLTTHLNNLE
jgi:tetratricopeptide (TPR) repeat protein